MLGIIRFTIKEHQTFEDILSLLNMAFQGKLWATFLFDKVTKAVHSYTSVCEFFRPPLYLFNSLVFPHVSPHLVILELCSVITGDRGGFMVHFVLCSFPSFLFYLPHMQIT